MMLLKIMEQAIQTQQLIAIYTDLNCTSKFSVGYLVGLNESYFLLERVSTNGTNDGYLMRKTDSVYRVELTSNYLQNLQLLMKYSNMRRLENLFCNDDLLNDFLSFAQRDKKVVTVELLDSDNKDIIGYVSDFDEAHCRIDQISETGEEDGLSVFRLEDVSVMIYNSEDEVRCQVLFKSRLA